MGGGCAGGGGGQGGQVGARHWHTPPLLHGRIGSRSRPGRQGPTGGRRSCQHGVDLGSLPLWHGRRTQDENDARRRRAHRACLVQG